MEKFFYNNDMYEWQRVDRVQTYKGVLIETITAHHDYADPAKIRNYKEYRITYPGGGIAYIGINKRGGNIKTVKELIDRKIF